MRRAAIALGTLCVWSLLGTRAAGEPMPASLQSLSFSSEKVAEEADAGRTADVTRHLGEVKKSLEGLRGQFAPERLAPIGDEVKRIERSLAAASLYDAAVRADAMSNAISALTEPYIGEFHAGVLRLGVFLRSASRETKRKSAATALQSLTGADGVWVTMQKLATDRQPKDAETMTKQLASARKHLSEGSLLSARRALHDAAEVLARLSSL